jgi:hypothetical protein
MSSGDGQGILSLRADFVTFSTSMAMRYPIAGQDSRTNVLGKVNDWDRKHSDSMVAGRKDVFVIPRIYQK